LYNFLFATRQEETYNCTDSPWDFLAMSPDIQQVEILPPGDFQDEFSAYWEN
jgi:hypothetical protein